MARYFNISSNAPTVKLDSQGRGSVQYTVKNVSAAPLDGRAVLVSLPLASPPAGAVQSGWVKLEGPSDHHFEKDEQAVFTVKIEVPPKDRTTGGTYTFRLDAVLVAVTDRGDEGPATAFTVEAKPEKKSNMLLWLIPVIAVAVIGIGIGLWLALRSDKVPDLTGKSLDDAVTALAAVKLGLDPNISITSVDADHAGKITAQNPAAGTEVVKDGTVHLTIGASKTKVPPLTGKTIEQAQTSLAQSQLVMGTAFNVAGHPQPGQIFDQSIANGSSVDTGTVVNVSVSALQVPVPPVTGKVFGDVITTLIKNNLNVAPVCPESPFPSVSQNPAAGTTVNVGTPVQVIFQCLPNVAVATPPRNSPINNYRVSSVLVNPKVLK